MKKLLKKIRFTQNKMILNTTLQDKRLSMAAIFFLFLFSFQSCKKVESDLGIEVLPEDALLNAEVDTIELSTYSTLEDSLRSDELSNNMLGSYYDPTFGKVKTSFYSQIRLSAFNPVFDIPNITIDSVVLALNISGFYGNENAQTFEVYQVTEDFYKDSAYYSNKTLMTNPGSIVKSGFETFTPSLINKPIIDGDTLDPQIRIRLDESFGNMIINGGANLVDDATFSSFVKGIYVTVNNPSQNMDEGGVYQLDLLDADSKITIYYHDLLDTLKFDLPINDNCARFTRLEHDFTGTDVEAQFADSTLGNNYYYLQAGAGVVGNVDLSGLSSLMSQGNIIINKAEIYLPVQYYSISPYFPPTKILAFGVDNNGDLINMPDFIYPGGSVFGGSYSDNLKSYKFSVTRYVQQVVNGEVDNNPIRLATTLSSVSVNRIILSGKNSPNREHPYLKVYYTKY